MLIGVNERVGGESDEDADEDEEGVEEAGSG